MFLLCSFSSSITEPKFLARCSMKSLHPHGKATEVSAAVDIIFSNQDIEAYRALKIILCFLQEMSYASTINETSVRPGVGVLPRQVKTTSRYTVSTYFRFCREVILDVNAQSSSDMLGGPGVVVEIDETKVGKRKYNKGGYVEGTWIIGFIEQRGPQGNNRVKMEVCPNNKRDRATLFEIIKRNVHPDTTIFTDCWGGYIGLDEEGFEHECMNHRYTFVRGDGVHTNTIESQWRALKRKLSKGKKCTPAVAVEQRQLCPRRGP